MASASKSESKEPTLSKQRGPFHVFSVYYKHGDAQVKCYDTETELRKAGIDTIKEKVALLERIKMASDQETDDNKVDEDSDEGDEQDEEEEDPNQVLIRRGMTMQLEQFVVGVIEQTAIMTGRKQSCRNEFTFFVNRGTMGIPLGRCR